MFSSASCSFQGGEKRDVFRFDLIVPFFHDKKLPSSNTFGFLNHFILHHVLQ